MLHLIMTLLLHGVYMESVKCPESCNCIQTFISSSPKVNMVEGFDPTNFGEGNSDLKESIYRSDLSGVGIIDGYDVISVNETPGLPQIKKCGKNTKNILKRNFTMKSNKILKSSNSLRIRAKRTLKIHDIDKKDDNQTNIDPVQSQSKSEATEKPSGNKDVFTYQITCAGLRDLKFIWIRDLPGPATELNIQRTNFQSFTFFQQILKKSSIELNQLTILSVSDSVINQKPDRKYYKKTESTDVEGTVEKETHSEFLPFASLQNPKLRSKSEIEVPALGKCKNLQVLNLTNTTIVYLPQDVFHTFINLQVLNLSNNLIEFIHNETFSFLINLVHLDIHNNRLQSLNEIMFKNLTKLLFLDVSQNLISNIEPSTFQYLVSLNVLILASNPLLEKQEAVVLLGTGKRLQIMDISKTGLKQIPGTLERSVRVLNLMGNFLLSIRCGDLDSYSLLAYLNLKNNKISYIEDDALGRLEFLKNLQISKNNLFQVPKILPNNLEILNLSYNNLQNITNSDFLNLSLLKELFLNYNQITNIEENAFSNLVCLKVVDLSRNPVLVLPNIFGQIKLTVLDLSYFTSIPASYYTRYKQFPVRSPQTVRSLNLEASPVLTKIFLQDTETLQSFTSLEKLNLRFSNLTTIRKDIFSILSKLKVLKVEGNPWHCGEEILTLSTWLKNHENEETTEDEDEVNTAHCLTPSQLYKTNLITLEEKDFKINQTKIDKVLVNTTQTISRGNLSAVKVENESRENFINISGKGLSEPSPMKKVNAMKYIKSVTSVKFLLGRNKTAITDSQNCCGFSKEKGKSSSRNNSAAPYFLPSKRESNEKFTNKTRSFFGEGNFMSWISSTYSNSDVKNSIDLKSSQVPLKMAEAVTAKDTLPPKKEYNSHISFLILSSIGLVAMATLTITSLYFTRARRDQSYQRQNQDIEVCSISSLGNELW